MTHPAVHPYGLRPTPKDRRDFSRHRVFGSPGLLDLPVEYSNEAGQSFANPYIDQGPTDKCSAVSVVESDTDSTGLQFCDDFQFAKTKQIEGDYKTFGVDMRDAMKAACKYGLLPIEFAKFSWEINGRDFVANWVNWPKELDDIAAQHKELSFFNVLSASPYDAFDSIRSAIWQHKDKKRDVIVGTRWLWENGDFEPDGTALPDTDTKYATPPWHSYEFKGWTLKSRSGATFTEPKLEARVHSLSLGYLGYMYFTRAVVNRELSLTGSVAFMFEDVDPNVVKNLQLHNQNSRDLLIALYYKLIESLTALIFAQK